MGRKKKQNKEAKDNQANVHKELKGLEININPFGEIETNYDIQEINKFLNEHVDDKKLREREELKRKGLAKDQQAGEASEGQTSQGAESSGKKADENGETGTDEEQGT